MKTSITKMVVAIAIAFAATVQTSAQTTHLRNVELTAYNKIQVSIDTEVILIKSKRNHVTLVGDSAYIATIPVISEDGMLSMNYQIEPDAMLKKVVIEYTNLSHATTGGNGTYYFHNLEEENLVVFNPYANVVLSGNTDNIRIVSQEGVTDLTALNTQKRVLHLGESAMLVSNKAQ